MGMTKCGEEGKGTAERRTESTSIRPSSTNCDCPYSILESQISQFASPVRK